jgi:hypothetical protein
MEHLGTEANPTNKTFIARPLKRLLTGDELLPKANSDGVKFSGR